MGKLLTFFDPTNPTSGTFVAAFSTGCGKLYIMNASAVDVSFLVDNSVSQAYVVQAGTPRIIPLYKPRQTIYYMEQGKLNTNTKPIQSMVYVESYERDEPVPNTQALSRHMNQQNIGFSCVVNQTPTANTDEVALSVFNPATSGVNIIVYLASYFVTAGTANVVIVSKTTDPAYGNAGVIVNRSLGGASSIASVTFTTAATFVSGSATIDIAFISSNQIVYPINYPDQVLVPPGNGVIIGAAIALTSTTAIAQLKWTETPV